MYSSTRFYYIFTSETEKVLDFTAVGNNKMCFTFRFKPIKTAHKHHQNLPIRKIDIFKNPWKIIIRIVGPTREIHV